MKFNVGDLRKVLSDTRLSDSSPIVIRGADEDGDTILQSASEARVSPPQGSGGRFTVIIEHEERHTAL